MDNLKKIEAFLDMPSDDDMVYGEALTEDFEENDLPAEIRIPASEYPEYDEYYDDEDGELYTELNIYIEDNYGVTPVDFHWVITPDEIIISDITWSDEEDIEPEVEEPEVDFPEDDVMEDLNEAKLRKNDLTDENLANFEMELQEIKDNLADFGPEGLYAVPYESFKREFPMFTEKVIESFLDEMGDSGEGDWQEGELIWENDWPCLIEGAEKLLNGKGFQWEKLYTKYYKPDNGLVEVNDVDDYDDDYDDEDVYEESLNESKLNEKLPSELITAIKKVGGFEKDYHLLGLDIEDAEAKIITPEKAKELKKDIIDNEFVCVIYNGDAYFPFTHKITPTFPKKPDGVSLNKLLNDGTIYYIKDRPRKHWKNRYRTYGDETNSHELTPDEKRASFEKSRWREFNYRNDEFKNRLAQVNKMRDDVFNHVRGMYESLNESSSGKDNIDIIEKELEADFYGLTLEDYYEDEDTLMISIRDAIGEIYDISIKKSELDQPGGLSYILFNELDLAIERGDVTEDRPVDESLEEGAFDIFKKQPDVTYYAKIHSPKMSGTKYLYTTQRNGSTALIDYLYEKGLEKDEDYDLIQAAKNPKMAKELKKGHVGGARSIDKDIEKANAAKQAAKEKEEKEMAQWKKEQAEKAKEGELQRQYKAEQERQKKLSRAADKKSSDWFTSRQAARNNKTTYNSTRDEYYD